MPRRSPSARRGGAEKSEETLAKTDSTPSRSSPSRARSRDSVTKSVKKFTDTETWVDRNLSDLIEIFGLDSLELTTEESRAISVRLVDMLRGESSSIDKDTIKRRFTRHAQMNRQMIAQMILEIRDNLTQTQLEFIVNNLGEAVLAYAPRLYREALRYRREDLIDILRATWKKSWVEKRYPILPVECPRCRFDSLMPDLSCIVCGEVVSEEELKRYVGFDRLLQDLVKSHSEEEVLKTITYGYVYLNSLGLKPPTRDRDKLDIELALSAREKMYLRNLLTKAKEAEEHGI